MSLDQCFAVPGVSVCIGPRPSVMSYQFMPLGWTALLSFSPKTWVSDNLIPAIPSLRILHQGTKMDGRVESDVMSLKPLSKVPGISGEFLRILRNFQVKFFISMNFQEKIDF